MIGPPPDLGIFHRREVPLRVALDAVDDWATLTVADVEKLGLKPRDYAPQIAAVPQDNIVSLQRDRSAIRK